MKITAVEAIPFAIPYSKPLKFASGEVHAAEHVLVRVHTDDGVVGVAEAPPRPFTGMSATSVTFQPFSEMDRMASPFWQDNGNAAITSSGGSPSPPR